MKIIKLDGKCETCGEIEYVLCGRCLNGRLYRHIIESKSKGTTTRVKCMLCNESLQPEGRISNAQCPHCDNVMYPYDDVYKEWESETE